MAIIKLDKVTPRQYVALTDLIENLKKDEFVKKIHRFLPLLGNTKDIARIIMAKKEDHALGDMRIDLKIQEIICIPLDKFYDELGIIPDKDNEKEKESNIIKQLQADNCYHSDAPGRVWFLIPLKVHELVYSAVGRFPCCL